MASSRVYLLPLPNIIHKRDLERFLLLGLCVRLIVGFPLIHRHAVKQLAGFFYAHVDAAFVSGCSSISVCVGMMSLPFEIEVGLVPETANPS